MLYTGLQTKLKNSKSKRLKTAGKNWNELVELSRKMDEIRYKPDHEQWNSQQAEMVFHKLQDPDHGVLPWLSKQASRRSP